MLFRSGTPTFDLQELPEGLVWDTSELLSQGIIKVSSSTGIKGIDATSEFIADVYTISGVKVVDGISTTMPSLRNDLKSRGLVSGTYIVRSGKSSIKISF